MEGHLELTWECKECQEECIQIRSESRCLCGHRRKEHAGGEGSQPFRCHNSRCSCTRFFFIVAQGAWMLRCQCKHKAVEHDPVSHKCRRCTACQGFASPWTCNCGHKWEQHEQRERTKRQLSTLELAQGKGLGNDLLGWDQVKRGDM